MQTSERVETAVAAAEAGAAVAEGLFREDLAVETKDNATDFVTRADREAQAAVAEAIAGAYPGETVVGEEDDSRATVPESGAAWVVDPIDGTNNYVRGIREWATSVACLVDGEPVAAATVLPALGDTYVADGSETRRNGERVTVSEFAEERTLAVAPTVWWGYDRRDEYAAATAEIVRRYGDLSRVRCAQATLALVAAGSLDAAITNVETNPWDTVAGAHMVERAGGRVTDLSGERWTHDARGLVASNGRCHDSVLAAARAVDAARD